MKLYTLLLLLTLPLATMPQSTLIGSSASSEYATSICADENENVYLGATNNNQAWVLKHDPDGNVLWSYKLKVSETRDSDISFMKMHGDTIYGCGWVKTGTNILGGFFFKLNAVTGIPYWIKSEELSKGYFSSMSYADGRYYLAGSQVNGASGYNGKIWAVSSSDGSTVWQTRAFGLLILDIDYVDDLYSCTEMINGKMYVIGRSYTYGASGYNMRPVLIGIDDAGNFFLNKYLTFDVTDPGINRFYGVGIQYDGDSLIVSQMGDDNCASCTDYKSGLVKTDLNGNVGWIKSYDISGVTSEAAKGVIVTNDGYLMYGYADFDQTDSKYFVLKTDKYGNVLDTRLISRTEGNLGSISATLFVGGTMDHKNEKYYFPGGYYTTNPGNRDVLEIILDENLEDPYGCFTITPHTATTTAIPPFSGNMGRNEYPDYVEMSTFTQATDFTFTSFCEGSVSFIKEQIDCNATRITADVIGITNPEFSWSDGTTNETLLTSSEDPLTVIITSLDNCCVLQATVVPLDVSKDLSAIFPNVITPDEDGINDVFDLKEFIHTCARYEMWIYNRWGNKVYTQVSGGEPFEGKDQNGNQLTSGVYFYRILIDDVEKSGFISIIR